MATVVEHDKRKAEILQKSIDVFVKEGYEDVTFQKIADRCGITRTTLYIYFKNKREIFLYSIKQLTDGLQTRLIEISKDQSMNVKDALRKMIFTVIDASVDNKKLLKVLLPYLMDLEKTGEKPGEIVKRRVIRMRHYMALLIIRGIKNGEFKYLNVKDTNEMLYAQIESTIYRLAVLNQDDSEQMKRSINLALDGICR